MENDNKQEETITIPLKWYLKLLACKLHNVPFYPDRTEEIRKELDHMIEHEGFLELLTDAGVFDRPQPVKIAS